MTTDQVPYTNVQDVTGFLEASRGITEQTAFHVPTRSALHDVASLSDGELLTRLRRCARHDRQVTATFVAHLAEVDARRLFAGEGYSSMFSYLTQALHYSEHEAYLRIEVARAARRYPAILEKLAQGAVHLTAVSLLSSHLTEANHRALLDEAAHKSKREIELLVARLRPEPAVPAVVRKLPGPRRVGAKPPGGSLAPAASSEAQLPSAPPAPASAPTPAPWATKRPAVLVPVAPERYKIQFTMSAETREKLRLVQDLLRHRIPDGDPAAIFDRALVALLDDLARKKLGAAKHPREEKPGRPGSRHIPAHVKRQVWLRDGGRCAFVAQNGHRCTETGKLEFHHRQAFAHGGPATVENVTLRCRAHNAYEAELVFGSRGPTILRESLALYGGGQPGGASVRSAPRDPDGHGAAAGWPETADRSPRARGRGGAGGGRLRSSGSGALRPGQSRGPGQVAHGENSRPVR